MSVSTDKNRNARRQKRHAGIRRKVRGTSARPRLNVFRSNRHIYAQVIDDAAGRTLVGVSTLDPEVRADLQGHTGTVEAARRLGVVLAQRAAAAGITQVVFDRGGYLYHGRVAAVAEGAREGGLKF